MRQARDRTQRSILGGESVHTGAHRWRIDRLDRRTRAAVRRRLSNRNRDAAGHRATASSGMPAAIENSEVPSSTRQNDEQLRSALA
jgi:hypothetical protein